MAVPNHDLRITNYDRSFLNRGLVYVPLLHVNLPMAELDLLGVLGLDGFGQLILHGLDARLGPGLVDADYFVVGVHVDVQGLAEGHQEVILVHLRMALDRLMVHSLGDLAQLGDRFLLQFGQSVRHQYLHRI